MTIFINNKSTKFYQITLCIKRLIRKRKAVLFFCLTVYCFMEYITEDVSRQYSSHVWNTCTAVCIRCK